ncbi:MAG: hypothetical protein ACHQ02_02215 [Candidatus Limnocylindrales bacterium]|jgi:hypothetical protein
MYARDRVANLAILGAALAVWIVVVVFVTNRSPAGDVAVAMIGAALIGAAFALTTIPLFWLAAFQRRRRIAYRGDWLRATRRGIEVGLLVTFFIILRSQDAFSWPLAGFVTAMVVFVEISLSVER